MAGAVRLGDKASVNVDAHGCPACPHPGIGPAIAGSPDVNVNGRPGVRLDDPGIHMACCGPNSWTVMQGSITVFYNGKPAARIGDKSRHCGGIGSLIEGSSNVIVGGPPGMSSSSGGGGGGGSVAGGGSGGSGGAQARTGGGGGGGGGGQSARGEESSSSGGGGGGGGGATGEGRPGREGGGESEKKKDDGNVYVVSADLKTPGGEPLGFEQVIIVKKGTEEKVAGPVTTDKNGHFAVIVPEQGQFDVIVVDDESHFVNKSPADQDLATNLNCRFLQNGVAAAGETVQVTGNGVNKAIKLDAEGELEADLPAGEYELKVGNQTFKAHTLRAADFEAGGEYLEFNLEPDDDDDADFEKARANRYSPSGEA